MKWAPRGFDTAPGSAKILTRFSKAVSIRAYIILELLGSPFFSIHVSRLCLPSLVRDLRACPCKNRPLKFSWKMDCLHFFYTSQTTYAMNQMAFILIDSLIWFFEEIFFVDTPKTSQTGNWDPKNWGLRYACSNFVHSMKQPNSPRITA